MSAIKHVQGRFADYLPHILFATAPAALTELDLTSCYFYGAESSEALSNHPFLTKLTLNDCPPSAGLNESIAKCANLKFLHLVNRNNDYPLFTAQSIRLLRGCTQLEELFLQSYKPLEQPLNELSDIADSLADLASEVWSLRLIRVDRRLHQVILRLNLLRDIAVLTH